MLQIQKLQRGATKTGLGLDDIRALIFPIAPFAEQHRIVSKIEELFSKLDAGVAALERAKANLKRYRASVLKAAVEGKLTEKWRAENPRCEPASKLLERILIERRRKWEEDQLANYKAKGQKPPQNWRNKYKEPAQPDNANLPELPDGWCWANISQLLIEPTCNGLSIKGNDSPPGMPALKLNAFLEEGFDYSLVRYLPVEQGRVERLLIRENDFFVSRGNGSKRLVGRGTLAQTPPFSVIFPDTMIRIRFSQYILSTRWVPHIWESIFIRDQLEGMAKTSAGIWKISQAQLESIVVPLPPLEEQDKMSSVVEEMMSRTKPCSDGIEKSLLRSARLRQAILKNAFEGKLVPQDPNDEPAEKLVERIRAEWARTGTVRKSSKYKPRRRAAVREGKRK